MLLCSSTLLREVLLSWMLYFGGQQVLELRCRRSRRCRRPASCAWGRGRTRPRAPPSAPSAQVLPGVRKSLKPEARNSAGIMASAPSTRKYFEMIGCAVTSRRIVERDLDRAHDQLVALQLHLAPGDVQRRDDLRVRRGRGVDEHRLAEGRRRGGCSPRRAPPRSSPGAAPTSTCAPSRSRTRGCASCAGREPGAASSRRASFGSRSSPSSFACAC